MRLHLREASQWSPRRNVLLLLLLLLLQSTYIGVDYHGDDAADQRDSISARDDVELGVMETRVEIRDERSLADKDAIIINYTCRTILLLSAERERQRQR